MNGKLALSKEQVPVIHQAYRPSDSEIAYARRMLASFERVLAAGDGSGVVDGEFMDPVTLGVCRAILSRADAPI
jgi:citrate lyase beta subunit